MLPICWWFFYWPFRPLFHLYSVVLSITENIYEWKCFTIVQHINVNINPYCVQQWVSISQPLEQESPPITTRPTSSPFIGGSCYCFCKVWPDLAIYLKFLAKVAQIFSNIFRILWKIALFILNWCEYFLGSFWIKLGYFLLQHLVALLFFILFYLQKMLLPKTRHGFARAQDPFYSNYIQSTSKQFPPIKIGSPWDKQCLHAKTKLVFQIFHSCVPWLYNSFMVVMKDYLVGVPP